MHDHFRSSNPPQLTSKFLQFVNNFSSRVQEIYDEPERAKWNDSEKRSFNGSWGKQHLGEKSDNFLLGKTFDKVK
ncbi:hypothetical protein TNCV_147951 [Trichonephila clavipes]|nr:hypothetical protein TNCV_147951 [Trichonephila clavipes]